MPTYEYACNSCGHQFDAVQSFTDDALTICPQCGGELRKVFGSVGIVFKGSGFYKNDSRGSSSGSKPASATSSGKDAPASEAPAAQPSETKPASKTEASSTAKPSESSAASK
jgi:putative FmdB family regulatory protein